MRALLEGPRFADEGLTHRARMFHQVALLIMGIATAALLALMAARPELYARCLYALAAIDGPAAVLLFINRRGHPRVASVLFVGSLILVIFVLALSAGGVRSPGVGFFLVFVLMAGLLLGQRAGVVACVVCGALGLLLVVLEEAGRLPAPSVEYDALSRWVLLVLYMGVTLVLLRMAVRAIEDALRRAHSELEARKRADGHLELALEAGAIGVWNFDGRTETFETDARTRTIFGLASPRVSLGEWNALLHKDDATRAVAALAQLRDGASTADVAYRFAKQNDGAERHVEAAARRVVERVGEEDVARIVGMVIDVTDRRNAELERERALVDLGERMKELRLLHTAAQLLRPTRPFDHSLLEELVAMIPPAFLVPEVCAARINYRDIDVTTKGWREAPTQLKVSRSTSAATVTIEVAYPPKDGDPVPGPSFLPEERVLLDSLLEILVAYLEQHEMEARRSALEKQLRHTQKMDALGTLAGGVAHDFNNILTAIGFNVEFALGDLPKDHPAFDAVKEIGQAQSRAKDLVKGILLFSRKQESERKVIALAPVVEETVKLLRASLPAMIKISTKLGERLPNIQADSSQLHQVLMNLGTNAGHAMGDKGGTLSFELGAVDVVGGGDGLPPRERGLLPSELAPGTYLCLSVRDTGSGMSKEIRERLFEPFFTTKGHAGTGLGLSVVHGIVADHGGTIAVDSELGRGSVFFVYLPAAASDAATAGGAAPSVTPRGSGERIMYVDDEEPLVFIMRRSLERMGYKVTGFTDPSAALQAFRDNPAGFDIVITDGGMPTMSGLQLARELRALRENVPVILFSGLASPTDVARDAGVTVQIAKPPTEGELGRALRQLVDGAKPSGPHAQT